MLFVFEPSAQKDSCYSEGVDLRKCWKYELELEDNEIRFPKGRDKTMNFENIPHSVTL